VQAVALSRDGQALVTGSRAGRVRYRVLNAAEVAPVGTERTEIHAVAVTAGGRTVATLEREAVRVWDARAGKQVRLLPPGGTGKFLSVAFASGGGLLAAGGGGTMDERGVGWIRLWETASGKAVRTLAVRNAPVLALAFTPDGKNLSSFDGDGKVHWWDVATGAELRQFGTGVGSAPVVGFSPDGRAVACGSGMGPVTVWDIASGENLGQLGGRVGRVVSLAFSPDGRTLAVAWSDEDVRLWEVFTARERLRFVGSRQAASAAERGQRSLAFSADGRLLAAGWRDVAVKLWDVASGAEVAQFGGHRHLVAALAFAVGDGRPEMLVSGSWDSTALVWDVKPLLQKQQGERLLTPEGLVAAWDGLASENAAVAHSRLWELVGDRAKAVSLLRERLRPAARPPRSVEQTIIDLDSRRFPVREKAMADLLQLGERIRPALKKALASSITLEVRRRVEAILRKLDSTPIPPARLRAVRAVEVLEHIGTTEARQILEALAGGDPEDQVTVEARASLRRLAHRPVSRPAAPAPPARSG
jgi:hypothetical protein